jgi:hypothetical protein
MKFGHRLSEAWRNDLADRHQRAGGGPALAEGLEDLRLEAGRLDEVFRSITTHRTLPHAKP